MSLLDQSPNTLASPFVLSQEELMARQDLANFFGHIIGADVEIMEVAAAMQRFYRSESYESYEPELPQGTATYTRLRKFDEALQIDCVFIDQQAPQQHRVGLWINYANRLGLSEETISFWGLRAVGRVTEREGRFIVTSASSPNEAVKNHNDQSLEALQYNGISA